MDDNMLMLMTLSTCTAALALRMWQWLDELGRDDSQEDLP